MNAYISKSKNKNVIFLTWLDISDYLLGCGVILNIAEIKPVGPLGHGLKIGFKVLYKMNKTKHVIFNHSLICMNTNPMQKEKCFDKMSGK